MRTILRITIDCGPLTCASEPGKFCEYLGTTRMGSVPVCMLFPAESPSRREPGAATILKEDPPLVGWVQRCQACLDAEKKGAET